MIKAIIFDFDGTLIELVEVHYEALNKAIVENASKSLCISTEEQNTIYNGLSTKTKLNLLVENHGLDPNKINKINQDKQKYTLEYIDSHIKPNLQLKEDLSRLKSEGYKLYCASNAMLATINLGLKKLDIYDLFDYIIGNDDVKRQKPAPDIYYKCFIHLGLDAKECLIVEDSKHGRESAFRSNAAVCTVDSPLDLTYDHLKEAINKNKDYKIKWIDNKLNILVPMAGAGSRFKSAGFKLPKPLIDVNGFPMIKTVINNLNIEANYIFLVQKEHIELYNIDLLLKLIVPNCKVIITEGLTEGAACTALLAEKLIDDSNHLLIVNSDQFVEWNSCEFMNFNLCNKIDGSILTFLAKDRNPKWSYVKEENEYITYVAEKQPISDLATVGIYWYNKGSDFVKYAKQMISKNIRVNNEFYIAPVYNEMLADGKQVKKYHCNKMWGLGTPEDLDLYLNIYKEFK